ncbi:hypothetical protein JCM19237_2002 [Photobacterium aphoticum]|uniref:Uncharacterized protein n=1 Tax=Photobacterium aphoticum TaxID=754436 RepID=A0A090QLP2_9GAMM|nr:hypothetical protein JCM19237_2002 [Photobacterium aphoticum]
MFLFAMMKNIEGEQAPRSDGSIKKKPAIWRVFFIVYLVDLIYLAYL